MALEDASEDVQEAVTKLADASGMEPESMVEEFEGMYGVDIQDFPEDAARMFNEKADEEGVAAAINDPAIQEAIAEFQGDEEGLSDASAAPRSSEPAEESTGSSDPSFQDAGGQTYQAETTAQGQSGQSGPTTESTTEPVQSEGEGALSQNEKQEIMQVAAEAGAQAARSTIQELQNSAGGAQAGDQQGGPPDAGQQNMLAQLIIKQMLEDDGDNQAQQQMAKMQNAAMAAMFQGAANRVMRPSFGEKLGMAIEDKVAQETVGELDFDVDMNDMFENPLMPTETEDDS